MCVYHGARRAKINVRHDVDEIAAWPAVKCWHVHSDREWDEYSGADRGRLPPHEEESEYTACFCVHLVKAASAWASRVGRSTLEIPRAPVLEAAGDRVGWLRIDPRALRSWFAVPVALAVGFPVKSALGPHQAKEVPVRCQVPRDHRGAVPEGLAFVHS